MRFGTSSAHEDLTGKDYNKKWKITKNTSKQVHIHIEQAGGVASVDIAPNGAITVTSAASISATAPTTHITSEVIVTGNVSVSGDVVAGSGSANISLLHHVHSGILPGPANTGAPV